MDAQVHDFVRRRGDTAYDVLVIKSASGNPIDITNYSFKFTLHTVEDPPDDTTEEYQLAGVLLTPLTGRVGFSPSAVQANRLGDFFYDIEQTDDAGKILTIMVGSYEFKQDYTKD